MEQDILSSPREAVCLHIGQAGVQMGNAVWELLSGEHEIQPDGLQKGPWESQIYESACGTFFEKTVSDQYCPRAVMIDLEPTVIDEIRSGHFRNLYHPDRMINGTEDAANTFARGYYSNGKLIQQRLRDEIRRVIEECDNLVCFLMYRALGGGTGSGTTSIAFDILEEYSKKTRIGFSLYPSPSMGASILEPYNSIMTCHESIEGIDMEILLDNETLYKICQNKLSVAAPSYRHINQIIAQATSSATACNRFPNMLYGDLNTVATNLVPYPRIHFVLTALAPFSSLSLMLHERLATVDITKDAFHKSSQLVECDSAAGKYMSCCLIYRGSCNPSESYNAIEQLKTRMGLKFVDWSPTGFKIGICPEAVACVAKGIVRACQTTCFSMTNNTAIGNTIFNTTVKFKKLFAKKAFVYWYVSEGMEEGDFTESMEDLFSIVRDYEILEKDVDETPTAQEE